MKKEIERVYEIEETIQRLRGERLELLDDIAKKYAPFSVGEKVIVQGYSHTGKEMIVDKIKFRRGWAGDEFVATGRLIKKSGDIGVAEAEIVHPVE